ncbi:ADP-glyceromanno-heptose 6-epimerase [Helicobacter marmotae]|uniref:ADP-glyceromanno-heptose 6-epimerase n=1 Tax=Helicobacter marmotae TaxID=152490 RepID=A0A3D8I1F9_9HELI|nr:ADP-glyceromanno-heptose 6-epimerase [Helicobacter marmotae]RDU58973.1 ADP-glyceromanno-heptose 6-epimerase [Helicobacter marmotae]
MKYIYDDLADKKILITGGAGFIGSNLAFYFQKHHPMAQVYVFDTFRTDTYFPSGNPTTLGHFKNLIGFKGNVIVGDITNPQDLQKLKTYDFDIIFHQAAISDTTVLDQKLVMDTNYQAFLHLLDVANSSQAMMIYASSAGTYGNSSAPNIIGEGEVPENVYGYSKLCMDEYVRKILSNDPTCPIIGLRYFNVYGAGEFYKGKTASMILQLSLQALKNKKVRLFKNGEQKRDFVYIKDVIQANVKAIESAKSGIYNVGSGEGRSFNEIVGYLQNALGDFEVEYFENPYSFFQTHTQADINATKEHLSYVPRFNLQKGIESYLPDIQAIYAATQGRD